MSDLVVEEELLDPIDHSVMADDAFWRLLDGVINCRHQCMSRKAKLRFSMRLLARAVAGAPPTEEIATYMVQALCRIRTLPDQEDVPWLLRQCAEMVRRHPRMVVCFVHACSSKLNELSQERDIPAETWYQQQEDLFFDAERLFRKCLCTLLVESGLHPEKKAFPLAIQTSRA
mmetsp:Transcript_6928/g.15782  ORF Transcript_6928/g.15782 Transcript_6928/m.15782 type:complete len:173 (+) Transcript_6928:580-1098(+)